MVQVNQHLTNCGQAFGELHPHHVFKLVAGTSTGGLIALMLGKMGLTVKECITQYEKLSRVVFGKKHFRGRITRGLAPAKYSGKRLRNCIRRLLCERQLDENLLMGHEADRVAWYVRAMRGVFAPTILSMATSQAEAQSADISTTPVPWFAESIAHPPNILSSKRRPYLYVACLARTTLFAKFATQHGRLRRHQPSFLS